MTEVLEEQLASQDVWFEDLRSDVEARIQLGRQLCNCEYPYHVLWPILRAAEITGSLRYREDASLALALKPMVKDGTRILIAGSADAGTLGVVGRIVSPCKPVFTVMDRCKAPLALIDNFAKSRGLDCQTVQGDLTLLNAQKRWDLIVVNYTLQFLSRNDRLNALKRLAMALVEGGTLVCVVKTAEPISHAFAHKLEIAWLENAKQKLRDARLQFSMPVSEIDMLLHQAAIGRMERRENIPSRDEIVGGLNGAGLILNGETRTQRKALLEKRNSAALDAESSLIFSATRR